MSTSDQAIEGIDFLVNNKYVIWRNRTAIRVAQESLNLEPLEFFEILATGTQIDTSDRGMVMNLKRKILPQLALASEDEKEKIFSIISNSIDETIAANEREGKYRRPLIFNMLLKEWFTLPISLKYPHLVQRLLDTQSADSEILQHIFTQPHWQIHHQWVAEIIARGKEDGRVIRYVLTQPGWEKHADYAETLLKRKDTSWKIAYYLLTKPHWAGHAEWVNQMINEPRMHGHLTAFTLVAAHWQDYPEWVVQIIKRKSEARKQASKSFNTS